MRTGLAKKCFIFACVLALGWLHSAAFAAAPTATSISDVDQQSLDGFLREIETLHKPLQSQEGITDRVFNPAMNSDKKFRTMDDSQEFEGSLLCQTDTPVVEVSTTRASAGELNIIIRYSQDGTGNLDSMLTIPSAGAICNGGAVYECAADWKDCKYGVIEQNASGVWSINHTYPSGELRPAEGLKGCFCFSNYCGGTYAQYMEQILSFAGQVVADGIASRNGQLVVSTPVYDKAAQKTTWSAGNIEDCLDANVSGLTSQMDKMELDYKDTVKSAEEDEESPWSLITKNLESSHDEVYCVQENKVASEWREDLERTLTTDLVIGWDTDGSSKQCFWARDGACGYYFGEYATWEQCLESAAPNYAGICTRLWVEGNHFTEITDVRNVHYTTALSDVLELDAFCYGAGDHWARDFAIGLQMDCVGKRPDDYYICYSASKSGGRTFTNDDPEKFDGCNEIRPGENGCAALERSEKCKLNKEITDGVYTIMNGSKTGATVREQCRIINGVNGSITVCEPWWRRTRTYICDDLEGFEEEKKRAQYISENTSVSGDMLLGTIGDMTFDNGGIGTSTVIDGNIQFQSSFDMCTPTCVVQTTVPNYELVVPQEQGKVAPDGSYHVEEVEPSFVPDKTRTIINTLDCDLVDSQYTCPVPDGWSLRSQCSCGDGREFVNAITALLVVNQLSKDLVCSTGEEVGQCDQEEGSVTYPVVCGNFVGSRTEIDVDTAIEYPGSLVQGTDYWECSPKLWTGRSPAVQTHQIYLDADYTCIADVPTLAGTDYTEAQMSMGLVQPQRSWFDPVIAWAESEIRKHFKAMETDSYWATASGCECGDLEINEIPVCQPTTDKTAVVCLSTGANYAGMSACEADCEGRATQGPQHICIWRDVLNTGNIPVSYNLKLDPEETAVFGEVYLNAEINNSVSIVDSIPICIDESVDEQPESFYQNVECSDAPETHQYKAIIMLKYNRNLTNPRNSTWTGYNADHTCEATYMDLGPALDAVARCISVRYIGAGSISRVISISSKKISTNGDIQTFESTITGQKDKYVCDELGTSFYNKNECSNSCNVLRYKCIPSGRVVHSPAECYVGNWRCSTTNAMFDTADSCLNNCKFTGVTGVEDCHTSAGQESFVAYIKERPYTVYGFDMELMQLPDAENLDRTHIADANYNHTDLILKQCLTKYTSPYVKFDEPGTNAHFEYAMVDKMIYYLAAQKGELPNVKGELPEKPAIYRGSAYRNYDIRQNELFEEELDENGNFIQIPKKLTSQEREDIIGQPPELTFDDTGNYNIPIGGQWRLIPRQPMFLGKKTVVGGLDPLKGGRAGLMDVLLSGLTSGIYYYECPAGVTNDTANCGQKAPYGGVADTIQGRKCFQYFCDDKAVMESGASVSTGCGLTNDGMVGGEI